MANAVKSKTAAKKYKLPPLKTETGNNIPAPNPPKGKHAPFQKGQVMNPAGRPKGSRNKLSENFLADMLRDWELGGQAAIQQVRINDPSTYLRVVAGLVPKEFSLKADREQSLEKFLEQFSDEQLIEFEHAIAALSAPTINQRK